MRSLKGVKYNRLVVGEWYSCIIGYELWYFKFLRYHTNGGVMAEECYSPYVNTNRLYYSKLGGEITLDSEDKINKLISIYQSNFSLIKFSGFTNQTN
jgi:hypothetical protein